MSGSLVGRLRRFAPHTESREDGDLMREAANALEPRVIRNSKELWSLPLRSVVLTQWEDALTIHPLLVGDKELAEDILPATILWTPGE